MSNNIKDIKPDDEDVKPDDEDATFISIEARQQEEERSKEKK